MKKHYELEYKWLDSSDKPYWSRLEGKYGLVEARRKKMETSLITRIIQVTERVVK